MSDATNHPLLEAVDLHKTYRMGVVDVPVLQGSSMQLHPGEWVAVLGASGSGKSTLLHLLGGLDTPDPQGGKVLFKGQNISKLARGARNRYRNREVGLVFQFYHLLPELNVLENTLLPGMVGAGIRANQERARDLLTTFGLDHRLTHRPRELSGGERQRVAIARALLNQPEVLLADELTGNLDEDTGAEILELLKKEHEAGLTILMVTHDRAIAELADRVVVLHHGRVEQDQSFSVQ